LGGSTVDIKKELKPLTEGLEDIQERVGDAKKSRSSISKKVGEVADAVEELSKVKDDISNVASKDDFDDLQKSLRPKIESAKEMNKAGLTKVGRIATKNQKYAKLMEAVSFCHWVAIPSNNGTQLFE